MISSEPYTRFKIDVRKAFVERSSITGRIVAILDLKLSERELHLITPHSRALRKNEICEIIVITDINAFPGAVVKGATYIGFFEVIEGGIALVGDVIMIKGEKICTIRGFDETHMPNHLNVVCYAKEARTGKELGIHINDEVIIFSQ